MENLSRKKFFNFRPILFLFVLCILSIYFSFKATINPLFLIFYAIPFAYICYLITQKRYFVLIFSLVILLIVSLSTTFYVTSYKDTRFDNSKFIISGKIESLHPAENCYCVLLSSVKITDESENSSNLTGNVITYIYGITDDTVDKVKVHTRIVFSAKLSGVTIVENEEINTYYLKNNIKYSTNGVSMSKLANLGDESTIVEQFRERNKTLLVDTFGEYLGNIAFASLYGDKTTMDKDFITSSTTAGLAHIFAVSGLHVGLFVLLLNFIFKRFRLKSWLYFILNIVFLFGFCFIFSFSQSTIRASIMALTLALAQMVNREYDAINAISFAGLIILLFRPLAIFELGFCMSFASVFGILLLFRTFSKLKIKSKTLKTIYLALATTLCAEVGLLPIYSMFGYFPTWSLLANLIILPLFTIGYTLLFSVNILVVIFPLFKFLYFIPKALYALVAFLTELVAKLPYATMPLFTFALPLTIVYFLAIYFSSHLVKTKPIYKLTVILPLFCVIIVSTIVVNLPRMPHYSTISFYQNDSGICSYLEFKNGKKYVILQDINTLQTSLKEQKITHLDGIFLSQELTDREISNNLSQLKSTTNDIYVSSTNANSIKIQSVGFRTHLLSSQTNIVDDLYSVSFYELDGEFFAIKIKYNTHTYGIFSGQALVKNGSQNILNNDFNFELDCARIVGMEENDSINDLVQAKITIFDLTQKFSIAI